MAIAETAALRFGMGRVVKRAFGVIGKNLVTFAILSLVVAIPLLALQVNYSQFVIGVEFNAGMLRYSAMFWFVYLLSTLILQAAIVHATVAYLNGKTASLAECLSAGLSALFQIALITVLMFLAFIVGAMLLVVPAIIWAMMWFVAVPACVVERTGVFGAFRRSRALTRGYRWRIFGLYVAYLLLGFAVGITLAAVTGTVLFPATPEEAIEAFRDNLSVLRIAASMISTMMTSVIGATLVASIYYELRQIKEGIGPEALAAVFD